jgi:hypothetical protein
MRQLLSVFAATLVAVAGCNSIGDVPEVSASVAVDSPQLTVGSGSVNVTITVTNNGSTDIDVADPAAVCGPHSIRVFRRTMVEIELPPRHEVCPLALVAPRTLHPGETATVTYAWHGVIGHGPADEPIYLAPGQYLLRARVYAPSAGELPSTMAELQVVAAQ